MYLTRAAWGARAPKNAPVRMNAQDVMDTFIHHGASPATSTLQDSINTVRSYQTFHMDTRGWNDIAYSFLVDQLGNVFEGRGWFVVGAHTLNHNSTSHAICWIGNDEQPSEAALAAIAQLISEAEARVGKALAVRPHSAVFQTTCPGDILRAWIATGRPVSGGATAPVPAPAPTGPPISFALSLGSNGPDVTHVQERLVAHSENDPALKVRVDGSFGPATDMAVRKFQRDVRLTSDGVVGPLTLTALNTEPQHRVPAPAAFIGPTLMRGASGKYVVMLQQELNAAGAHLTVDGQFGPATETAVRGFQTLSRLTVDGIAGQMTWAALA